MFGKKKENYTDLPDLPEFSGAIRPPSIKNSPYSSNNLEKEEIHSLPSFPDSPMKRGFSQSAIKEAINTEDLEHKDSDNLNDLPEFESDTDYSTDFKLREVDEWIPKKVPLPEQPSRKITETKPIYVRLDKFQSAKDSLDKIKKGLDEIDFLLKQMKEIKMKEEQELSSWEKEMENVKSRIANITSDIFDRV